MVQAIVLQLHWIGRRHGTEISYDQLVNPRRSIPYESQRIHGISDSDVRGKPDFSEIADNIAELVEGSVLIGHNVRQFDLPMLRNEFFRIGALPPEPKAVLDTLEMVRRLKLPRPHRLGAQCSRHGISLENAHTASADAAASLLLLWKSNSGVQLVRQQRFNQILAHNSMIYSWSIRMAWSVAMGNTWSSLLDVIVDAIWKS